jgi:lytic murein transglycosylase
VSDYVKGVISDERVAVGRRKRAELAWLPKVEQRFGVPGEILIAIWAMESAFGAVQGDFDAMRSLATLAAAGRRRDWAETQLRALIRIIAEHRATRAQLRGSWAGAMGQTQLGPDSYLTAGVDFDGDDRVDVWKSAPDALASAANLLAIAGWRRGEHWHREVLLPPGFDYGLAEGPKQAPAAWAMLGVRTADGGGWSPADGRAPAVLFLPAGAAGPALLLLPNHFAIRAYNNSSAYALAAGLLADHIGGAPGLVASWPHEDPLSLADRIGAQKALARLGFDPGASDGAIGTNTRAAIRAWQKSRKLPADGYLSLPVVRRLEAEAADPIGAAAAAATS